MSQSHEDALLVSNALASRFLSANRRELREATGLDYMRLHRAILHCEHTGILLAEDGKQLSLVERLYELRK